jgi:hypothetical protein
VRALTLLAESRIRAAIAEGELDDLPGHSESLPPDDLARVPAELRYRLLVERRHRHR